uniref:EF-hand domain-containing protein n=1 Tax=Steinernema glaseri TaxID=37863 RepID=A0A1I8A9V4_9BILA
MAPTISARYYSLRNKIVRAFFAPPKTNQSSSDYDPYRRRRAMAQADSTRVMGHKGIDVARIWVSAHLCAASLVVFGDSDSRMPLAGEGGAAKRMRGGPRFTQLPDHFVDSLKVLFDVVDADRKGYVTYEQICAQWRQLPTSQLPGNFLECLGRIAPPSGKLTFERFLAGIRLALVEKRQGGSNLQRVRSEGKLDMDEFG